MNHRKLTQFNSWASCSAFPLKISTSRKIRNNAFPILSPNTTRIYEVEKTTVAVNSRFARVLRKGEQGLTWKILYMWPALATVACEREEKLIYSIKLATYWPSTFLFLSFKHLLEDHFLAQNLKYFEVSKHVVLPYWQLHSYSDNTMIRLLFLLTIPMHSLA